MSTLSAAAETKPFLPLIIVAALLICLVNWSGQPPAQSRSVFLIGVALLISVMLAFGAVTWHLLWRPLPAGHADVSAETLPLFYSQLLGTLVLIAMINIIVGGMWDEVWHREYGLPFGEDLFWRPHLMLYTGFGLITLLAFSGIWMTVKRSQGSLQQRFRRNPSIGLLAMLGGFLLFALPTDPIWHTIYGEDITAWSLPHLLLLVSTTLIGVLGSAMIMAASPPRKWRFFLDGTVETPLLLVAFSGVLTILLIVLVTEWDSGSGSAEAYFRKLGRPDWLLPVMIVMITAFIGHLSLQATRRYGSVTIVGLFALLIRVLFVTSTPAPGITNNGWLLVLFPLLTLDLLYWGTHHKQSAPAKRPIGVTITFLLVSLAVTIPIINRLYAYPTLDSGMYLPIFVVGIVAGLPVAWLGSVVGDFIYGHVQISELSKTAALVPQRLRLVIPAAVVGVVVFILFFVLTATPPV